MIGAFNENSLEGILYASPMGHENWNIRHLFVVPKERRKGTGRALINKCMSSLYERGVSEISADYYSEDGDGTNEVDAFLHALGFSVRRVSRVLDTTLDALSEGASRFGKIVSVGDIRPLSKIEDELWEGLPDYFSGARISKKEGDTDAILYRKNLYHGTISRYLADEKKKIKAILLVRAYKDALSADYLWCDDSLGIAMVSLISSAVREALVSYPEHTHVTCHMMNPVAGRIVEKYVLGKTHYIGTLTEYISFLR